MDPRATVWFDRKLGRRFYPLHRRIYQLTGGLVGHHSGLGPMLLLTTSGRRTGQQRTTPLLYMPDGEDYLVVASNGGRDPYPAWFLNLGANPDTVVQVGRRRWRAVAETLDEQERAGAWPVLTEHYNGWDHYQQLTDRPLPVVRLRTAAGDR